MASRLKRRSSLLLSAHSLNQTPPNSSSLSSEDPDLMGGPEPIEAEEEAQERRARKGFQKRQSIGHSGVARPALPSVSASASGVPISSSPVTTTSVSGYSAAQLAQLYQNCMKLSAENKINMKNAFDLNVIDYMTEMIKKKESEMNNFSSASCALDASTKIYAYRVDSVHSETLKLASGVGTSSNKNQEEGAAAGDGEGGDGGAGDKKKKKRKKASTVERNLGNINCGKFDLEYEVDPLFKKVSAQFDSGSGGGQFLSTLRMRDDSCELLLDSNALLGGASETNNRSTAVADGLDLSDVFPSLSLESAHQICPTFSTFTFRNWSVDDEDDLDLSTSQTESDNNGEFPPVNDEHVFDPQVAAAASAEAAVGDDDMGDFFGGDDYGEDQGDAVSGGQNAKFNKPPSAQELWEHLALVPSEYTYFDSGSLGAWAGPHHWKFKTQRGNMRLPPSGSAAGGSDSKAKKKKERERMDFGQMEESDNLRLDLVEKAMTVPKKSIKLQNRTMENWDDEKLLLPEDMHYKGSDFLNLEHMPRHKKIRQRKVAESQAVDASVDDYNFDNLNDSQNFCPDVGSGDDGTTTFGDNGGEFTNVFSQTVMQNSQNENNASGAMALVDAPNKVEKIQIGYAKLAKKVDMRRLKRVELSILQDQSITIEADKENTTDVINANEITTGEKTKKSDTSATKGITSFSNMYKSLMTHKHLPTKMQESLSVPLAFVALLHLCNEEVLTLATCENLADLTIQKG